MTEIIDARFGGGAPLKSLQDALWEDLRPRYRKLVHDARQHYKEGRRLYGFAPLVGGSYQESRSRLLVVGRAVDGWRKGWDAASTDEEIVGKIFWAPDEDRNAGCPMNWLPRNMAKDKGDTGRYNFRRSSFWSASRDVLTALEGRALGDHDWTGLMAWSNVYKISPARGNPGHLLRSAQINNCMAILRAEIEMLKPRHILFVTGGWGKKVLESVGISAPVSSRLVRFNGKLTVAEGRPLAVVADRPEGKKRKAWVEEVLAAFRLAESSA